MKAFKVVYRNGHFIDTETKKRLLPVQNAVYTITAEDKAFKDEDAKEKLGVSLDSKAKAAWANRKYGDENFGRIMEAKAKLFFRIGNSRIVEGDQSRQYIFVCSLLEDLYLYKKKGKKGEEEEDWRLAECMCKLDECLLGGLTLTSTVPSKSLNALFNYTVQDYFRGQRSGATNALKTFFIYEIGKKITFEEERNQIYNDLSKLRREFVSNRK